VVRRINVVRKLQSGEIVRLNWPNRKHYQELNQQALLAFQDSAAAFQAAMLCVALRWSRPAFG